MKQTVSVCAAVMIGFLLGVLTGHQTSVNAQAGLQVYVEHHDATTMSMSPTTIPGRQIVGFSCVLDGDKIFTNCYTAYVK